jgi:hypothetical protein
VSVGVDFALGRFLVEFVHDHTAVMTVLFETAESFYESYVLEFCHGYEVSASISG